MQKAQKRATVYFDPRLYKALRLRATETEQSVSEIVNDAARLKMAEDVEDLTAFKERAREPNLPFEKVLTDLRSE
jgi:hypothetical protein